MCYVFCVESLEIEENIKNTRCFSEPFGFVAVLSSVFMIVRYQQPAKTASTVSLRFTQKTIERKHEKPD